MTRWDRAFRGTARRHVPLATRRRIALARVELRRRLPLTRLLPGALVIGAQRGGTSSLFTYLGGHPDVAPSLRKEVAYFTQFYRRGPEWYGAHFPVAARDGFHRRRRGRGLLAFEATPEYLFDPRAAARAAALVPDARIVALLRNPVDRAFSHWHHMHRRGHERLSFPQAIASERERLGPRLDRLAAADPLDRARDEALDVPASRYSYVARGRYAAQLERWLARYPRERVLVVRSEDFYADTPAVFASILAFLELPPWNPPAFRNVSLRDRGPDEVGDMEPALRAQLAAEFFDDNARLYRLIGRDLGWNEEGAP